MPPELSSVVDLRDSVFLAKPFAMERLTEAVGQLLDLRAEAGLQAPPSGSGPVAGAARPGAAGLRGRKPGTGSAGGARVSA